jgi:hypothetical protein
MGDELDRIMAAINSDSSEAVVIAPPPTQAAVSTISPTKVWACDSNNDDNYIRPSDGDYNPNPPSSAFPPSFGGGYDNSFGMQQSESPDLFHMAAEGASQIVPPPSAQSVINPKKVWAADAEDREVSRYLGACQRTKANDVKIYTWWEKVDGWSFQFALQKKGSELSLFLLQPDVSTIRVCHEFHVKGKGKLCVPTETLSEIRGSARAWAAAYCRWVKTPTDPKTGKKPDSAFVGFRFFDAAH